MSYFDRPLDPHDREEPDDMPGCLRCGRWADECQCEEPEPSEPLREPPWELESI